MAEAMNIDLGTWQDILCKLLAGHQSVSPFSPEESAAASNYLRQWCREKGYDPAMEKSDIHDVPDLRLLQAFLKACGDPDAPSLDAMCRGVQIGYMQNMPRTPAVYNQKTKWRLEYEDLD